MLNGSFMFSLSDYLASSGEVDKYNVNVVDQILRLGNFKKLTQVVSKDKKRRGNGILNMCVFV